MSRSGIQPKQKGRRVVVLAGVTFVVLAGAAVFLSWDHLRFWRLFESLGPNEQGYEIEWQAGTRPIQEIGIRSHELWRSVCALC